MPDVTHSPRLHDVQRTQDVEARRKATPASGAVAETPKVTAQRHVIEASFGAAAQRAGVEEEEPLQGKAVQRVEEEEPLQGKAVQRVEEEEPLQGKAVQRVEEEEPLQGKAIQRADIDEEEPVQGRQRGTAQRESPARPNRTGLPDPLKAGIENLSGHAMDDVKVHYNSDKPATLDAHAYAQGSDIHVAPGQEKHLPHEAWHTVQQAQGRVKPTTQMAGAPVNDDAGLEAEADVMGAKAMQQASRGKTPEA